MSQQVPHVVEVVKLFAQSESGAFHGEKVRGLGDKDLEVTQVQKAIKRPSAIRSATRTADAGNARIRTYVDMSMPARGACRRRAAFCPAETRIWSWCDVAMTSVSSAQPATSAIRVY